MKSSGLFRDLALILTLFQSCGLRAEEPVMEFQVPEITIQGIESHPTQIPTANEISGSSLERKKRATIGETLAHEPGVAASSFGPSASRPVIRGQEGDRVRILQNGTGVLDASAASQDHAVAVEPLTVERIELVHGPAALLYGSQTIGGIINMVSTRIPEKMPAHFEGRGEIKGSTTDAGRSGALAFEAPLSTHMTAHVDGALRATDDYHAPGFNDGRIYNSANRTASAALGTSYIFDKGFLGTAFSDYESKYGTVAERLVHINLLQQRWDLSAERRDFGFFKSIRAKNSYSHYKHDEMEGSELGTSFKNEGDEARLDFAHRNLMGFSGTFGLQYSTFTFSAKGEESFLPITDNQGASAFVFEEMESGWLRPSFGARWDQDSVRSRDDLKFGNGQKRNFAANSAAVGLKAQLNPLNVVILNGAYSERSPNYEELFANGPHAATAQFEIGNVDLKKERSQSVELTWKTKAATTGSHGSLGLFLQDVKDYIALVPSNGASDPTSGFEIFNYYAVDARFYGAEGSYLFQMPSLVPGGILELELKVDSLRGINRRTSENLPRITPIRESIDLTYKTDDYQGDIEIQRSESQTLTAPGETRTGAYTMLNVGAQAPLKWSGLALSAYWRLTNLLNVEARNHVSVLKDVSPLPGRSLSVGLRASF